MVDDMVKNAEARHHENSVTYFDALQRIVGACDYALAMPEIHADALTMIRRIAAKALPKR